VTGLDVGVRDSTIRLIVERGTTLEFHGPADITQETTDAIVNAANSSLLGGGGVDGAIHRAGGSAILEECRQIVSKIESFPAGKAVITTGGRLAAKYVIHTVGPVYRDGGHGEVEQLASCHRECIRLADEHALKSFGVSSDLDWSVSGIPSRKLPPSQFHQRVKLWPGRSTSAWCDSCSLISALWRHTCTPPMNISIPIPLQPFESKRLIHEKEIARRQLEDV